MRKIIWNSNGDSMLEQHERDATVNIFLDELENDPKLRPMALGHASQNRWSIYLDGRGIVWMDTREPGGGPRALGYVSEVKAPAAGSAN